MVFLVVNRNKAVVLTVGGGELCCSREAEFGQTGLKGATSFCYLPGWPAQQLQHLAGVIMADGYNDIIGQC